MFLTTPSRISADVRRLCRKIGRIGEPIFVPVSAPQLFHESELNDCFFDVRRQIEKHGGTIQHGWTIWEWPGLFIEGEFHAVWRDPSGSLTDVTPKKDGEEKILFVPDNERVFEGKRRDNVRLAIGRDPRIKELLRTQERFQRYIQNRMKEVPFGTPFKIEGEGLELQKKAARLEIELIQSRSARRAQRG